MLQMLLYSHGQAISYGELFNASEEIRKKGISTDKPLALNEDPVDYLKANIYKDYPESIQAAGFRLFYTHARNGNWSKVRDFLKHPDIKVIHLMRKNLLDRYLSYQLALRSNIWITMQENPEEMLAELAEEQSDIVPILWETPEEQQACAMNIHLCGGSTKNLPIAMFKGQWVSAEKIATMSSPPEPAVIIDPFRIKDLNVLESYSLVDTVFVTLSSGIPGILHTGPNWPETRLLFKNKFVMNTLAGVVINALCIAWNVSIEDVLQENDLEREEEVIIGKEGKREIKSHALTITKPR